jgi:hypothetical protein
MGATEEDLRRVVSWAQKIRVEGEALQTASTRHRPRGVAKPTGRAAAIAARQRELEEQPLRERRTRYEMDRALLEGVVAGRTLLDVRNGQVLFLSGASSNGSAPQTVELPAG